MQLLYNSESFAVVQFDLPAPGAVVDTGSATATPGGMAPSPSAAASAASQAAARAAAMAAGAGGEAPPLLHAGAFEIVDKFARREIFIQGALAERFRAGVESIVAAGPSEDLFDDFIAGFTEAAQQPVLLH